MADKTKCLLCWHLLNLDFSTYTVMMKQVCDWSQSLFNRIKLAGITLFGFVMHENYSLLLTALIWCNWATAVECKSITIYKLPLVVIFMNINIIISPLPLLYISMWNLHCVMFSFFQFTLSLSLSLPSVFLSQAKGDGHPPRAWFCSRFLPIKRELFHATVTKCLLMGWWWVFCK